MGEGRRTRGAEWEWFASASRRARRMDSGSRSFVSCYSSGVEQECVIQRRTSLPLHSGCLCLVFGWRERFVVSFRLVFLVWRFRFLSLIRIPFPLFLSFAFPSPFFLFCLFIIIPPLFLPPFILFDTYPKVPFISFSHIPYCFDCCPHEKNTSLADVPA